MCIYIFPPHLTLRLLAPLQQPCHACPTLINVLIKFRQKKVYFASTIDQNFWFQREVNFILIVQLSDPAMTAPHTVSWSKYLILCWTYSACICWNSSPRNCMMWLDHTWDIIEGLLLSYMASIITAYLPKYNRIGPHCVHYHPHCINVMTSARSTKCW